jgi:DNA-binding transcriptional LysR family regulator
MDVRSLTYFLEVAKHSSFSKASQNLHITQPTLSKMIKNLEEELGVTLFDRSTRRMQLTEAGEAVRMHAQMVLQSIGHLHSALEEIKHLHQGQFSLGLPPVIGPSFFPGIIARFRRQFPQVEIRIVEEGGRLVEQQVLEGTLDLGVVVLPVDENRFEMLPLVERELHLVVHARHPLSGRRKVHLAELKEEDFIMFRKGFSLYDRVREACIQAGFEPKVGYESAQWDFIAEMAAAGLGIGLLPDTVCSRLDPERVRVIPETEPQIHWNLALIWRKNGYLSHAARGWVDFLKTSGFFKKPPEREY